MVSGVRALGLETCMTLGMMTPEQAAKLKAAGLDYYNHNLDSSREFYPEVISTRTYDDRLDTLRNVREAGMKVCSGGILGMGERREDRVGLIHELSQLPTPPESVPVNRLVPIEGTPQYEQALIDDFEFVRTIAVARIVFPRSAVRLSAGREGMPDALQALCFYAGANSIFYGDKLLTTGNPAVQRDQALLKRLDLKPAGLPQEAVGKA
jgi:biotin synthase